MSNKLSNKKDGRFGIVGNWGRSIDWGSNEWGAWELGGDNCLGESGGLVGRCGESLYLGWRTMSNNMSNKCRRYVETLLWVTSSDFASEFRYAISQSHFPVEPLKPWRKRYGSFSTFTLKVLKEKRIKMQETLPLFGGPRRNPHRQFFYPLCIHTQKES